MREAFADAANLFDDKVSKWNPNGGELERVCFFIYIFYFEIM